MGLKKLTCPKGNAFSISQREITPSQKVKFHRKQAIKNLRKNNFTGYRFHSLQVAKVNSGIVIARMKGKKASSKAQMNLPTMILIGVVFVGFIWVLSMLNSFVGGSSINLYQYWGTPVIWGIGVIAITSIIAYFVQDQFHVFGASS